MVAKLVRSEDFAFHGLKVIHVPFGKLQVAVMCLLLSNSFCLATPQRLDRWSAAQMVVILQSSSISTKELWIPFTVRVVGHVSDQSWPGLSDLGRLFDGGC